MTPNDLCSRIRESGMHNRCDLSPLLSDAASFAAVTAGLAEPFRSQHIAVVAALDATGFALGGAVACHLGAGLVLLRKPGKAAWVTLSEEFTDYSRTSSAFHLVSDAISFGQRVLVVDDWSETGAQAFAAIQLLERVGAIVVGAAFINVDPQVRADPRFQRYQIHAVLDYPFGASPASDRSV